jgi:hypothetical protein
MLENDKLVAPQVVWAVATNFAYLKGEWFRVLLEVAENDSASSFASEIDKSTFRDLIRIPTIYQNPPRDMKPEALTFCMGIMSREALRILVTGHGPSVAVASMRFVARKIQSIELGTPLPEPFKKSEPRVLKSLAVMQPNAAIVAVIDDGLAFAHERFRNGAGKTRFKYFWNQDDTTGSGLPLGFGWGRELTEQDINGLLGNHGYLGVVDEDGLYREAGQNLAARRVKHGTHIMDVACGLDPQQVTADSPYLIGVQLPKWVTEETDGTSLYPAVHDAISYVLSRADQIASDEGTAPLPVVINLSYGTIAGPHDGTGAIERAIDQFIAARPTPLRVVLPAGNSYLARCHASFKLAGSTSFRGSRETLRWRIQPDDRAASSMEIWFPEHAANQTRPQVEVRLTSPTGEMTPWVVPGSQFPPPTTANVRFLVQNIDPVGQRPRIVLWVAPTTELAAIPRTAPSGTWLVEVRNRGSAVSAESWVQRGDTPFGYPLWGRQSRFDDSRYVRFDLAGRPEQSDFGTCIVCRKSSVSALATGQLSIVIGGFRRSDGSASEYSGAGPVSTPATIPPPRIGPDASAVADDSVAMHGILAAGTRSGSVVAMNGTSVAAPQVTRRISEWMTTGLATDRAAVQAFAASHDPKAPAPGSIQEKRLGEGRIEGPEPVGIRWQRL